MKTADIAKKNDIQFRHRFDKTGLIEHMLNTLRRHVDTPTGYSVHELEVAVANAATKLDYYTAFLTLNGRTTDFDDIKAFVDDAENAREENRDLYIASALEITDKDDPLEKPIACGDENEEEMQYAN